MNKTMICISTVVALVVIFAIGAYILTEGNDMTPEQGTDNQNGLDIELRIGGETFTITLKDNDTASAFVVLLPIEAMMTELNGNEKYLMLEKQLPSNPEKVKSISAGDVMLYQDNCLVIFYKDFETPYSYTRIGHIGDTSGLEEALGTDDVHAGLFVR